MSEVKTAATRKFGIDFVGDIEWGTHLCQFYQTKKHLTDILVPYFAEGLKSNEFCMWITSPPLEVAEARRALRKAVPDLDKYIEKGQIEILSYEDWYLPDAKFDANRVLQGWVEKEKNALERGYEGLRLTGNTFWIERNNWRSFANYEAMINDVIGAHRMIALCTYSLKKCRGSDVIDVVRNHAGILIRKGEAWNLVGDVGERKKAEEKIKALSRFPSENPNPVMRISKDGVIMYCNKAGESILDDWSLQIGQPVPDNWRQLVADAFSARARKEFEEEHSARTFLLMLAPIVDAGYVNVYGRDITERKKAEEEVLQAKNEWERTFDSMPELVAIVDKEHRILRANKAMAQRLGGSPDQCVGLYCFTCVHGLDRPPSSCPHSLTLADGKEHTAEIHEDNLNGDFLVCTSPLLDQSGNVTGSIHVARDITERKRADQALQESQKDLNRAQAVARTGSWRLDVRHNELLWSEETYRMFGIPKATPLTYEAFLSYVHPDDKEYVDRRWQAALRGEPYDIEHRIIVDGKVKWVREKAELELDKDGNLIGGFGTVQDITERKELEEKLIMSERKYRTLYETSMDGFVSVDMSGNILECNDAYAHMLGYTKDELKNLTYQQLTPERWRQKDEEIVREQIVKRGYSDLFEKEYFRKDGSVIPIGIRVWLIRDERWKPAGMWGIVRDITQSKQLENELKRHTEHLERLVEERTMKLKDAERLAAIGETAAMVGHDIRNPLQTVEGAIYLAKEEIKALPSRTQEINNVEEMLKTIEEETTYVNKIVSDLQDYARPLQPQLEKIDTQELINGALATMRIPRNIEISLLIEQDCCIITADATMMKRILANLITNALQAMPNGGKLTIAASRKQDEAYISVQDTGQGIPDENKEKIFTPLFSTKAKGQGFGLPVVKRLVEAHNGTIAVNTEVGKGTTFTVIIPVAKEAS